jgi:hypothetical protein
LIIVAFSSFLQGLFGFLVFWGFGPCSSFLPGRFFWGLSFAWLFWGFGPCSSFLPFWGFCLFLGFFGAPGVLDTEKTRHAMASSQVINTFQDRLLKLLSQAVPPKPPENAVPSVPGPPVPVPKSSLWIPVLTLLCGLGIGAGLVLLLFLDHDSKSETKSKEKPSTQWSA